MERAVRDEQKEQRRNHILDVAWRLFRGNPYETITMAQVAREAGLAKGTVYLYFKTKEHLFLAILQREFAGWFTAVNEQLAALSVPSTPAQIARLFTDSLAARPALIRLFSLLHLVLERNIDYETALGFKQTLREQMEQTGILLEMQLPFLAPGEGGGLLLQIYALMLGVQQMADPAPVIRQIWQREAGMEIFAIPFAETFTQSAAALIRGVAAQARNKE